jgi:group I intron endonuclease
MISGVYSVNNLVNGKRYIGSTNWFAHRKNHHFNYLKHNNHPNAHLQNAYNKYGKMFFEFKILLYCEIFELLRYEQEFINALKPEYNKRPLANSNIGCQRSEKTKKLLSILHKGNHHSDETKRKIGLASLGNKYAFGNKLTDEQRKKIGDGHKGLKYHRVKMRGPQSEECKRKISAAKKGKHTGQIPWNKGMVMSPEHCKKLSDAQCNSSESRKHISELNASKKDMPLSDETRERMSIAHIIRYASYEIKYQELIHVIDA